MGDEELITKLVLLPPVGLPIFRNDRDVFANSSTPLPLRHSTRRVRRVTDFIARNTRLYYNNDGIYGIYGIRGIP